MMMKPVVVLTLVAIAVGAVAVTATTTDEAVNQMAEAMLRDHEVGPFTAEHEFETTLDRILSRGLEPTPVVTLDKFHAMHKARLGFSLVELGDGPQSSDPSCKDGHACPLPNGLCCASGDVCCPANNPCVVDEKTKKTTCDESPDMKFLRWKMKDEAKRKQFEQDIQKNRDKHEESIKNHDKKVSEGMVKYHKKQAEEENEKHKKHMEEEKKRMAEQEHKHHGEAEKKKKQEEKSKKANEGKRKEAKKKEAKRKSANRERSKKNELKQKAQHKANLIKQAERNKKNEARRKQQAKAHEQRIKRNRCTPVRVWSAGLRSGNRALFNWKGRRVATGSRGLTMVALHPHNNRIIHRATYDTYASHGRAIQMARAIRRLPNGARVMIGCRDECSRRMHPVLKRDMSRFLRLRYHRVLRFRWSYAAIAVKNGGLPYRGRPIEAWNRRRLVTVGWKFNCPRGGWIGAFNRQEQYYRKQASRKQCANLHVWSQGFRGNYWEFRVNNRRYRGHGNRGFNVLTINGVTKRITGRARFDTYGDRRAPNRLARYLNRQPRNTIILIACSDECSRRKSGALNAAWRRIGVRYAQRLGFRHSYAAIAWKGRRRAIEHWPHNNRRVHTGARFC